MSPSKPRRFLSATAMPGVLILFTVGAGCHRPSLSAAGSLTAGVGPVGGAAMPDERLAATDPLAFLKRCRAHCAKTVFDYRARFIKRERMRGELSREQQMDVLFREKPFSVSMHWVKNADMASRITYVAGRWVEDGEEMALIHPSGVLSLLVPSGVMRDIHGRDTMRAARRSIDQFGFKNTVDLIIQNCERAAGDGRYSLRYVGLGEIDGRGTYVFERRLPYDGPDGDYPDRLLVIDIDREWFVPTGSVAYADDDRTVLLGKYLTTHVELNVGLTDEDF